MDDEWEEEIGGEDLEGGRRTTQRGRGVVEEDFESLPPRQRRGTTRTHSERGESPPMAGGTQVPVKTASSVVRPTLSSEGS